MARRLLPPVILLVTLATSLWLSACSQPVPEGDDAQDVRATVVEYNAALVRAYDAFDMNELSATATEDQAWTEYYLMAALGEGGVQMHATLISIEFDEVAFTGDAAAKVTTTEVWDYDHISLDTSETVRSERGVTYRLRYDLVYQDGLWLVDGVTSLDESAESQDTTP